MRCNLFNSLGWKPSKGFQPKLLKRIFTAIRARKFVLKKEHLRFTVKLLKLKELLLANQFLSVFSEIIYIFENE
ncbi:hypothetical protein FBFR_14285 [Flavobacterium fryxellicola]|uniref:Uncharacterized protein n=1 Tax=Flavobacterium fryxellicola TaxID=249352 RepID=A0A167UKR8_9FLAO|nr:hypothetical protein FBFR_14285 [Flavobacterium fryxellicola]